MALTKCKECKKEVSNSAKVCPHCGIKNPGVTFFHQLLGIILIMVILAVIVSSCSGNDEQDEASETVNTAHKITPDLLTASTEDFFGAESQLILDTFKPKMMQLINSGLSMEPLRQSNSTADLTKCGDLMRQNKAKLDTLNTELQSALSKLPEEQSRWHKNFDSLYNANANLTQCVTCLPTAIADCQDAKKYLTKIK